jgi:hypothetical protein|tara:strand:+ start:2324 stop:2767 length:444 start_codon:yes stop_codon:yes gene_type:complete
MTEFRKNTDGTVESALDILAQHKNTSFPSPMTNEIIEGLGYKKLNEGTYPATTPPYESLQQNGIKEISGEWYKDWTVVTATGDEKTAIDTNQAQLSRNARDGYLAETDWAAGSDVTMSDDMKTYRQNLRDVPTQSGFPHAITWPTKP